MKKKIIIAFIYLSGCVVAYINMREDQINRFHKWTQSDRVSCLALSLFSWASVAMNEFIEYGMTQHDKPANW